MDWDLLLRLAHIMGAVVLMGTGAGIAFFMVIVQRSRDPKLIAHVAGIVVLADTLFTATAAIAQPITGALLAWSLGWSLWESWIVVAIGLYLFVGIFWLPVVWIQIRLRDLAQQAADQGEPLPEAYHRLYRIWFAFGWPAFAAMIAIFWVMLARPNFW
ncbi:Uncharacterized membrane protein [Aliiroseovarius halocynthiae]|uniref:DUF2269 domain-containing protein n=1 Tax=Aliiroseovarius halocynthiae TaxID=985055 RepID=A0A545STR7_9RHOB|nr:DUF2269 domain-containing protein [Aliiroseovarius halocynthiae]TQV68351.1 DUF2269 domain-containing protein [Aliiroseovarius halocynthiae]SMR70735.1 Uncharacterized membrane protein [Aliiroseovarius halocynthiae]